ncbi:MAG: hypothetical protein PHE84_00065 [bacterium]|nr:hypothetical protein [bacterium]
MGFKDTMTAAVGKMYENLYKLPGGEALVRGLSRNTARMAFYNPVAGLKKRDSLPEIKEDVLRMCKLMEVPMTISKESPDQVEFLVAACPYGYNRKDQMGVCDAVMDLDRTMVKLCGGSMVIEECIPGGAPKCRVTIRKA